MNLKQFQLNAIRNLKDAVLEGNKEVILKSCTGSGKTIILTTFMQEFMNENPNTAFIWLTTGKGNLEEQSKEKMDLYVRHSSTKLLNDILISGINAGDSVFINWELLTNKKNVATKESENKNFQDIIKQAKNNDIDLYVCWDESHIGNTIKSNTVVSIINPKCIIKASATPKNSSSIKIIEISEDEVIASGLIKRKIIINQDVTSSTVVFNEIEFLLDLALKKQQELQGLYLKFNKKIVPKIFIQLPNKQENLLEMVEDYLIDKGITFDNKKLAIWLDKEKVNTDLVKNIYSPCIAVIGKQAISTGFDATALSILVKLRTNMEETFEIQTIGRIRRTAEGIHYNNIILDSAYIYTIDKKFIDSVKDSVGRDALEAKTLTIKEQYKNIRLIKEFKKETDYGAYHENVVLSMILDYFYDTFNLENIDADSKKVRFIEKGYSFNPDVERKLVTGEVKYLNVRDINQLNTNVIVEPLNSKTHSREYLNKVTQLANIFSIQYDSMNKIITKLFNASIGGVKLYSIPAKQVYSFVINNFECLKRDFKASLSYKSYQSLKLKSTDVKEADFKIPEVMLFTYNGNSKVQDVINNNVYDGYLSSAEIRSNTEKMLEKYLASSNKVDWFYKNGDKGDEYLSIVYKDNADKAKSFYPDYIVSINNQIWIIEAKGGWQHDDSEDIDNYTSFKFNVLKKYLKKHQLNGGIVRFDKSSNELFICTKDENYSDDINDNCWKLLKNNL